MRAGDGGGLYCGASGTLGVLVKFPAPDQDVYLLSCSHVIANCGQFNAPFGDVPEFRKVVQQPVATPCDASVNRVGLLQDGFSVIVSASEGTTRCDLALAKLDPAVAAETNNLQSATGNSIVEIATEDPAMWQNGMQTWLLGAINRNAGNRSAMRVAKRRHRALPGRNTPPVATMTRSRSCVNAVAAQVGHPLCLCLGKKCRR